MKTVVLATLSFTAFIAQPALLLTATALLAQGARRPDPVDDVLLATYLVAVASVMLPRFRAAPWVATVLFHLVPGIVLGIVTLLIARVLPGRPSRPPE
jgi:hypothetical protein